MTSDVEALIALQGGLVTISQKTEGAEDGYGDPAVTWTDRDDQERVWIQNIRGAKINEIARLMDGNLDISTYIGLLMTDTAIVTGNIVTDEDDRRFKVGKILSAKLFGYVSHKEAHLMFLEEGA